MWAGEQRKPEMEAEGLPYSIELPDGGRPALPLSLLPHHVLCVLVSEDAGFAHQALILQLLARYFPVDGFQAEQKGAMTKPAQEEISAIQSSRPLAVLQAAYAPGLNFPPCSHYT